MEVSIFQKNVTKLQSRENQLKFLKKLHIHKYNCFLYQRVIQINTKSNICNVYEKVWYLFLRASFSYL